MIKKRRTIMAAMTAALLALVIGASYAAAQEQTQTTAGQSTQKNAGSRGRQLIAGEVVKIENGTITLKTIKDGQEKTVKVDDQTRYRKDGKDASLADVITGEKIGVRLGMKPEDGQDPTAKAVMIGKPGNRPGGQPVVGTVSAINGDTVTIATAAGDKQVKLPTITQGMRLGVVTGKDGTVHAVMYNPPDKPRNPPDDSAVPAEAPADI
ncbi:MAG: hypothetical protein ACYDGS_03325 [Thermoleophilia bacterium]